MRNVKTFRTLCSLKRFLNAYGIPHLPFVNTTARYIKEKYFSELTNDAEENVIITLSDIKLVIPKRFIRHYVFEDYEPVTRRTFIDTIQTEMTVVDIGAHVGYYSLLAAKKLGMTGKVYAVEPGEESLRCLHESLRLNGFMNLRIHPYAAGKSRRKRIFHITESSDSHGFYPHPMAQTLHKIEVDELPLDEIVDGPVDAIKIDVEGAELEVLEGMSQTLAQNQQLQLWVEWNPASMKNAGHDPLELPARLSALGFNNIQVLDDINKKISALDQVIASIRSQEMPTFWYGNLWARRH